MTTVDNKFSGFVKKTNYGAKITKIKNDYATNASLDSKINDLKAQHFADEVKKVDDKTKKNARNILGFESRLKQKKDSVKFSFCKEVLVLLVGYFITDNKFI